MRGLDLSKFRKVSSDEKKTVFKHEDGHFLHVSHAKVKNPSEKKLHKMGTQNFADGGEVDIPGELSEEQMMGAAPIDVPPESDAAQMMRMAATKGYNPQMAGQVSASSATPAQEGVKVGAPEQQAAQPQGAAIPAPGTMLPGMRGIAEQERGIAEQLKGEQMAAQARERAAQDHQRVEQELMTQHQQRYQELATEKQAIIDDMKKGHIDPSHYYESIGTGGKIATAIGLILGGFGAPASGGRNLVMDHLQKQIDRDVEAQVQNMHNKSTLVGALSQQMGDLNSATAMAKAVQTDLYASKLEEAAAKSADPLAKARALWAAGQLHMQSDMIVQRANIFKSFSAIGRSGNQNMVAQAINWLPEHDQAKAREELGKVQAVDHAIEMTRDAFAQLANKNTITGNINASQRSDIQALKGKIASLAPEVFGKTTEQEVHIMLDKMIPNVLSDKAAYDKAAANLINLLEGRRQAPTLEGYNLKPDVPSTSQLRNHNSPKR